MGQGQKDLELLHPELGSNVVHVNIDKTFQYILSGVFGSFALAGIMGNIVILYIVGYKRSRRFGSDAAICTMAVLDIINGPVVIWELSLVRSEKDSRKEVVCKMVGPMLPFLIQTSTWLKAYVAYSRMK